MALVESVLLIENQQYKPNDTRHWVYSYSPILYIMILLSTKVANSQMNILAVDYLINIYYLL